MSTTPEQNRQASFDAVRAKLTGYRQQVYDALLEHGPCDGTHLSHLINLSILTVRPRLTELRDLGFIEALPRRKGERETQWKARTIEQALAAHTAAQEEAEKSQHPQFAGLN